MCSKLIVICALLGIGVASADETPRDPTRPSIYQQVGPATAGVTGVPKLSSVLIGADRRLAVVDGRVMSEGEERSGVKVWEIRPDRVVVSVAGQEPITLLLDAAGIHKEIR